MFKNRNIIIGIIIVLILVSLALVVSFAFEETTTVGNETVTNTIFKNKKISIEYNNGTNELITSTGLFNPGSTLIKAFSIKNTGNKEAKYSISLKDVINTFERKDDITYELKIDNNIISSGIFPSNDTILIENEVVLENETKYYSLTIKYNESEENQIIDSGKTISAKVDLY